MMHRLTLATSSGLPFLVLALHVMAGTVGLVSGSIAIAARKGGVLHRRAGLVFVYAMIAMGLVAVGIAVYERKQAWDSGAVAAYLVFTAWTAVSPLANGRRVDIAAMLLAAMLAIAGFARGVFAIGHGGAVDGVPVAMVFFMATIVLLATIGDARMIRAGGVRGARRIARHLWRMCFGLFIATGSFVAQLVRMTFMPHWTRSLPVILFLSAGPLVVLAYWMWRVRLRQNLRGIIIAASASLGLAGCHRAIGSQPIPLASGSPWVTVLSDSGFRILMDTSRVTAGPEHGHFIWFISLHDQPQGPDSMRFDRGRIRLLVRCDPLMFKSVSQELALGAARPVFHEVWPLTGPGAAAWLHPTAGATDDRFIGAACALLRPQ